MNEEKYVISNSLYIIVENNVYTFFVFYIARCLLFRLTEKKKKKRVN